MSDRDGVSASNSGSGGDDGGDHGHDRDRDRGRDRRRRDRDREQRRDSRRPPRSLQVAVAVGLGFVLLAIAALGVVVYLNGAAPGGLDVPQAEFQFSYDESTGTLAVEHVDGATYTAENTGRLYVAVNGTDRGTVTLPFGPDDRHVVEDVPAGQEIEVVWVAAADDEERAVGSTVAGDEDE